MFEHLIQTTLLYWQGIILHTYVKNIFAIEHTDVLNINLNY